MVNGVSIRHLSLGCFCLLIIEPFTIKRPLVIFYSPLIGTVKRARVYNGYNFIDFEHN